MVTHAGIEKPGPRVQRTAGQKQPRGLFLGRGCFTFYAPHDAKAAIKMFAQKGNSSIDEFPFCS